MNRGIHSPVPHPPVSASRGLEGIGAVESASALES